MFVGALRPARQPPERLGGHLRVVVLRGYGVPLDAVVEAIDVQSSIYPTGQLGAEPAPEGTVYTYTLTLPPTMTTAEEFSEIIVYTTSSGEQVKLATS